MLQSSWNPSSTTVPEKAAQGSKTQCRIPAKDLGTSDLWISYCVFSSNQVGTPPEPPIHDKHLRQRKRQLKAAKQCRIPARELGTSDLWISYFMFSSFFELICDSWLKSCSRIYLNFLKSWVCGLKGGDYPPVFSQAGRMGIFFSFFSFYYFLFLFLFLLLLLVLLLSSHADRPAAVHRKCYGQHQGCRSTSLAGSAPGLSNKAPANSCQSISTARLFFLVLLLVLLIRFLVLLVLLLLVLLIRFLVYSYSKTVFW